MRRIVLFIFFAIAPLLACGAESICFGSVGKGRLENGAALPAGGKNFKAYSAVGVQIGRTYLHRTVREIVLDAYQALEQSAPGKSYVYGETGWKKGGRIRPHRTHQNGTSVDFMVPVKGEDGRSMPLPTSVLNKYGYSIEFDDEGRFDGLAIDFDAMAKHLYQLSISAKKKNAGIALVIFDPVLMRKLFATERGPYLKNNLPFMKGQAWIRHDEHYHVDFSVPCKPF